MSVFRPLNSEESNLFTIRLIIDSHSLGSGEVLVDEGDDTETYLLNPTVNNLPSNFRVEWSSSTSNYEIEFGKTFTSYPSIHVTSLSSSDEADDDTISAYIPSIYFNSLLSTDGVVNAYLMFRDDTGARQQAENGFMLTITGPVKLGVTTGNSNKGWGVGSGSDPSKVYSYMDVGIGTGNPTSSLDVSQGTFLYQPYVSTITDDTTLTSSTSGAVYFLTASSEITITLPNIDSNYVAYKFVIGSSGLSSNVTIVPSNTVADDGTTSTSDMYFLISTGDSNDNNSAASGSQIEISNSSNVGDHLEVISDGTSYFVTGRFVSDTFTISTS